MNATLQPLQLMVNLHERLFESCLDGLDEDRMRQRPNEQTNHLGFLACHVVDARCFLTRLLGGEAPSPFEDLENVRTVEEMRAVPPLSEIRAAWVRVAPVLTERLRTITPAELAGEAEPKFPVEDRTLLGVATFLLHHEAYHIGQLALVRKFLGLAPMRYA